MAALAVLALAACTQPGKVSVGTGMVADVPHDAHPYVALDHPPDAETAMLAYTDKQFLSRWRRPTVLPGRGLAQIAGSG